MFAGATLLGWLLGEIGAYIAHDAITTGSTERMLVLMRRATFVNGAWLLLVVPTTAFALARFAMAPPNTGIRRLALAAASLRAFAFVQFAEGFVASRFRVWGDGSVASLGRMALMRSVFTGLIECAYVWVLIAAFRRALRATGEPTPGWTRPLLALSILTAMLGPMFAVAADALMRLGDSGLRMTVGTFGALWNLMLAIGVITLARRLANSFERQTAPESALAEVSSAQSRPA